MRRTSLTTTLTEEPKLSVLDFAHFMRSFQNPVKREIAVGSMDRFTSWAERELPLVKDEKLANAAASLGGVPVKVHPYLPENAVVLTVNGEVEAIIKID